METKAVAAISALVWGAISREELYLERIFGAGSSKIEMSPNIVFEQTRLAARLGQLIR
jgi:hypothetical protein